MTYTRPALGDPGNSGATSAVAIIDALSSGLEAIESSFGASFVHVESYGAVADGAVGGGVVASGNTTFSAYAAGYSDRPFRASDVGKSIRIGTLDFSAAVHTTTITAVNGAGNQCTLAVAPSFTSSLAKAEWGGTDNMAAIQAAIDDADGRTILLGPGVYRIDGSLLLREGTKIVGAGGGQTIGQQSSHLATRHSANKCAIVLKAGIDTNVLITADPSGVTNGVALANFQTLGPITPTCTYATIAGIHDSSRYGTNWYLRNVLMEGGWNSFIGVGHTQMWMENCVPFFTRSNAVEMVESPDNWFVNNGLGSDMNGLSAAMKIDAASPNNYIYGNAFQFSRYGLEIASEANIISHNRFTDNHYAGLVLSGNDNAVSGNLATSIAGGWWATPYGGGSRTAYYVAGSRNTLSGNGAIDHTGAPNMQKGVWITGSASNNKVFAGATNAVGGNVDSSSGSGNVIL